MSWLSLNFQDFPPPNVEQIKDALPSYVSDAQRLGCLLAPETAVIVMEEPDGPQPGLERETDRGYAVGVENGLGDESKVLDIKLVDLSHRVCPQKHAMMTKTDSLQQ